MAGFDSSTWIARPPAEVFAYATDLRNATDWIPELTKVELVTEGPIRPGSRFRETRRVKGREHSAIIEVTEHQPHGPPLRHAGTSRVAGVEATYRYTFNPERDGTRVDLAASVRALGFFGRFLVGMVARAMENMDGDQLERLKVAVEARPRA